MRGRGSDGAKSHKEKNVAILNRWQRSTSGEGEQTKTTHGRWIEAKANTANPIAPRRCAGAPEAPAEAKAGELPGDSSFYFLFGTKGIATAAVPPLREPPPEHADLAVIIRDDNSRSCGGPADGKL